MSDWLDELQKRGGMLAGVAERIYEYPDDHDTDAYWLARDVDNFVDDIQPLISRARRAQELEREVQEWRETVSGEPPTLLRRLLAVAQGQNDPLRGLLLRVWRREQELERELASVESDRSYYAEQAHQWERNEIEQHQRVEQLEQAYEYMLAAYYDSEKNFINESSSTVNEDLVRLATECDELARKHLGKGLREVADA